MGHPQENGWWPLNIFHYQFLICLVNMEPIQGNHDRSVELSLMTFNFRLFPAIALSKKRLLNFGWLLNRGKDSKETLIRTTKW